MSDDQSVPRDYLLSGSSSWDAADDWEQVEALKAAAECCCEIGLSKVCLLKLGQMLKQMLSIVLMVLQSLSMQSDCLFAFSVTMKKQPLCLDSDGGIIEMPDSFSFSQCWAKMVFHAVLGHSKFSVNL